MKKRLLIESMLVSAIIVSLLSTGAFATTVPDDDTDWGNYGSYATASVEATLGDPTYFTYETYFSSRYAGLAENDGNMYYCYFIDEVYIQGYDSDDTHDGSSGIDCTLAASYTVANFKYGIEEWSCTPLAYVQI